MANPSWTKEEMMELYYALVDENSGANENFKTIATKLGKSKSSIRSKYRRTDWELFIKDPDAYLNDDNAGKQWGQHEMSQLDAFLQSEMSYPFIASKMGRTPIAVEIKAQETDWEAWRLALEEDDEDEEETEESLINQMTDALVHLSRHDHNRLRNIRKDEFMRKINYEGSQLPVTFRDLKKLTEMRLGDLGLDNPERMELGEGTYIIVGDSHGKHTKRKMFSLLKQMIDYTKADSVIHLGHILDDDNDISYLWGDLDNLIVLSKIEELKAVQQQRNKYNFNYDIVRSCITMGDLTIMNQDLISDYVKTPLKNLDAEIFDPKVIVNCHRMESVSKCSNNEPHYFVSPGSLCERHIIKTIRQIDFTSDKQVKMAFHAGFTKYRRMEHMYKYWNQGMLVVNVDRHGNQTIIPCPIKQVGNQYATSYFDKIITENGPVEPDEKVIITGDLHCPSHDSNVLDILEQVSKDYKPDILINLGDMHDYKTINRHDIGKGNVIFGDILKESAEVYHVLQRMAKWAPDKHLLLGNHERFSKDFTDRFPQLAQLLNLKFLCSPEKMGYNITDMQKSLSIGPSKFVHGDLIMYGESGSKLEKASRTFGHDVFVGHLHQPAMRFGCYSVGFAGNLDQEYNEPQASAWMHGVGLCNHYQDVSFPTSIAVLDDLFIINNKRYKPIHPEKWILEDFSAEMQYNTKTS